MRWLLPVSHSSVVNLQIPGTKNHEIPYESARASRRDTHGQPRFTRAPVYRCLESSTAAPQALKIASQPIELMFEGRSAEPGADRHSQEWRKKQRAKEHRFGRFFSECIYLGATCSARAIFHIQTAQRKFPTHKHTHRQTQNIFTRTNTTIVHTGIYYDVAAATAVCERALVNFVLSGSSTRPIRAHWLQRLSEIRRQDAPTDYNIRSLNHYFHEYNWT